MNRVLQGFRVVLRFVAGAAFWLHALLLIYIPTPPISVLADKFHLRAPEFLIISLLALFTALWSYGVKRFTVDLVYIYFFPFVFLYYLVRTLITGSIFVYRVLWPQTEKPVGSEGGAIVGKEIQGIHKGGRQLPGAGRKVNFWKGILVDLMRPFRQFSLLWCLLLLLSSNRVLIWIALVVVLLHLVRLLWKVFALAVFSIKWLMRIEDDIREFAESLLAKVAALPKGLELTQDLRLLVSKVVALRLGVQLLQNRRQVSIGILIVSFCAFTVFYLYIALIFSFAYYGIARVQLLPFSWAMALVTSIFMPVAYTDLPPNFWIKLVGGVQWLVVVTVGIGVVIAYFQKKLQEVYRVSQVLKDRFEDPQMRMTIDTLQEKLKPTPPPVNPTPKGG